MAFLSQRRRAYLADVPRLGKTAAALAACRKAGLAPAVICPAGARMIWQGEAGNWPAGMLPQPVYIASYNEVIRHDVKRRELDTLMQHLRVPVALILDEAHYVKSLDAQRTAHLLGKDGAVRKAHTCWALSGTPMPNMKPAELYTLASTFRPRQLLEMGIRNYRDWYERFGIYYLDATMQPVFKPGVRNREAFRDFLRPWMLRRTWLDVFGQVQPVEFSIRRVYIPPAERPESGGYIEMTPEERKAVGLAKLPYSLELIEDDLLLEPKLFVTAYHLEVLDRIQERLRLYNPVRIDGSTSSANRERAVAAFQSDPRVRVMIGQIQATAEAIPLWAANVHHMVEPSWTPEQNVQSGMRIALPGKTEACTVYMHALANTVDEAIIAKHLAAQREIVRTMNQGAV